MVLLVFGLGLRFLQTAAKGWSVGQQDLGCVKERTATEGRGGVSRGEKRG